MGNSDFPGMLRRERNPLRSSPVKSDPVQMNKLRPLVEAIAGGQSTLGPATGRIQLSW